MRTLASIEMQGLIPGDDILVIGDAYDKVTAALVDLFGPLFRYIAIKQTRDWGHSQCNYGLKHVRGDWVIGQDDDDIFLPRAFDEMRLIANMIDSPRPIIGRVMTPHLGILWREPLTEPLDGHCLVLPNDKSKQGTFGLQYAGDQDWMRTSLMHYDAVAWADRVWAFTRPNWTLWARNYKHTEGVDGAPDQWVWHFHRPLNPAWEPTACASLTMYKDGDHMCAKLLQSVPLSFEEVAEIAEFTSYAGQGDDVWFVAGADQPVVEAGFLARGYVPHQITSTYRDYIHTWPPTSRYGPVQGLVGPGTSP